MEMVVMVVEEDEKEQYKKERMHKVVGEGGG